MAYLVQYPFLLLPFLPVQLLQSTERLCGQSPASLQMQAEAWGGGESSQVGPSAISLLVLIKEETVCHG